MNTNKLKPIIKWSGGKTDEIKFISEFIPEEFTTYIEPFVGGGALFFWLQHDKSVIADVHSDLINFYSMVKEGYSEEIYNRLTQLSNNEETYYQVRDNMDVSDDLERSIQFYYLRKTCYRGMLRYNKKGKFNIPFGRYKTFDCSNLLDKRYELLLKNTIIHNYDFEKIFNMYDSEDNFVFLDPPYDSKFTDYGFCIFGKEEHERLAECFKKTKNKCLMVIGKTDFIVSLYKDYIVYEYPKSYRFKLHSKRVGNEIDNTHLVIKNY